MRDLNIVIDKENDIFLSFDQLEESKQYRVLHGGEKDHGYTYTLRNGVLFNLTKGKNSSLGFNRNIKFIASNEKFKEYSSIDFTVEFHSRGLKVGCQDISKEDAFELALDIIERYSI